MFVSVFVLLLRSMRSSTFTTFTLDSFTQIFADSAGPIQKGDRISFSYLTDLWCTSVQERRQILKRSTLAQWLLPGCLVWLPWTCKASWNTARIHPGICDPHQIKSLAGRLIDFCCLWIFVPLSISLSPQKQLQSQLLFRVVWGYARSPTRVMVAATLQRSLCLVLILRPSDVILTCRRSYLSRTGPSKDYDMFVRQSSKSF